MQQRIKRNDILVPSPKTHPVSLAYPCRALALDTDKDHISLFRMLEPLREPMTERLSHVEALIEDGKCRLERWRPRQAFAPDAFRLTMAERFALDMRYQCVRAYEHIHPNEWAFSQKLRSRLVDEAARPLGVHRSTVRRWRNRFFQAGCSTEALAGRFRHRGDFPMCEAPLFRSARNPVVEHLFQPGSPTSLRPDLRHPSNDRLVTQGTHSEIGHHPRDFYAVRDRAVGDLECATSYFDLHQSLESLLRQDTQPEMQCGKEG